MGGRCEDIYAIEGAGNFRHGQSSGAELVHGGRVSPFHAGTVNEKAEAIRVRMNETQHALTWMFGSPVKGEEDTTSTGIRRAKNEGISVNNIRDVQNMAGILLFRLVNRDVGKWNVWCF